MENGGAGDELIPDVMVEHWVPVNSSLYGASDVMLRLGPASQG